MVDDVPGAGPAADGRPVTRRQLRLAAQAAERERALERERAEARAQGAEAPVLPEAVPDEPEVDDVRWDTAEVDVPVTDDGAWETVDVEVPADDGVPVDDSTSVDESTPAGDGASVDDDAPAAPSAVQAGWPPLPADLEATRPVRRFPAVARPDEDEATAPPRPVGTWPGPHPADVPPPGPPLGVPVTRPVPPEPSSAAPASSAAPEPAGPAPAVHEPSPPALPHRTVPAAPAEQRGGDLPTLDDLLARRGRPQEGPAELGWRATVRRLTGGLVRLPPGPAEQRRRADVAAVRRELDGPRTIVVVNPKGGAHKTTATLLLAATFGTHRGGYTLAWDNNETRGTLGWRSRHAGHTRTAVDLLSDLARFEDPSLVRVGDLDAYVRAQPARFDVLASDEDAASAASIDADAFRALHGTLSRFYRIMVVDTGNNMRASNWQAALEVADQVVLVTTVREDTAQSAAWAADALRATGHEDAVRNAVTVLADPAVERDRELGERLHDHFGRLTRAVVDVPYDPALVAGGPLDVDALAPRTLEAWLRVTATVARGL